MTVERSDALDWATAAGGPRFDLCFANLFLHHFDAAPLAVLLRAVAASAEAFVACEPRRGAMGRVGSRLLFLLGANEVTRGDAVTSVAAGFAGREIGSAWSGADAPWITREFVALPFVHCFAAVRRTARRAENADAFRL